MIPRIALTILAATTIALAQDQTDWTKLAKHAAFPLGKAIDKGLEAAGEGVPIHAELEQDKGRVVYSIDVAQGQKTCNIVLDAKEGEVVEKDIDKTDHSAAVKACKITLLAAIESAVKQHSGTPIEAELSLKGEKPVVTVNSSDSGFP